MEDWWQATFPQGRQSITITDAQGYPVQIAYGEKGQGRPLVFVPGLGVWSVTWRQNIDFFASYFRVICVDNKGYGFSDKPPYLDESGYKIIELKRVLSALCDQPAIVITESLWSTVGLAVAEETPELFAALVVIGATIFPTQLPTFGLKVLARLPMGFIRWFDRMRLAKYMAPVFRQMLRQERSHVVVRGRIPDQDVEWQAYPFIEFPNAITRLVMDVKLAHQQIMNLHRHQPSMLAEIEQKLPQVSCPTLVLWGQKDAWFAPEGAVKLANRLPNAKLNILTNCGHDVSSDCPDELNDAILDFLHKVKLLDNSLIKS